MEKIQKTEAQWRACLPEAVYRVCREKGTEPPFSGAFLAHKAEGVYQCGACGAPLFSSAHKFDSGSGWPSFWAPVASSAVTVKTDNSHGMVREEVVCARCESHLGHRFDDGPQPSGQRYCINSIALGFAAQAPTE